MTKHQYLETYGFAGFPLVDTRANFVKPTRFGDDVTVESTIDFGTSSFTVKHRITLKGDLCAECTEKRVWVVRDKSDPSRIRAQAIPPNVLEKFTPAPR